MQLVEPWSAASTGGTARRAIAPDGVTLAWAQPDAGLLRDLRQEDEGDGEAEGEPVEPPPDVQHSYRPATSGRRYGLRPWNAYDFVWVPNRSGRRMARCC